MAPGPHRERDCSVPTCDGEIFTRGWYSAHYFRCKRTGDIRADEPVRDQGAPKPICGVEVCDRPRYARGWCQKHYKRARRHGDPLHGADRPEECTVDGCDRALDGRGLCHGHLQRLLRNGDVDAQTPLGRRRQPATCTVEGCDKPSNAKGLCRAHRNRQREHGDALRDLPLRAAAGDGYIHHGYRIVPVPDEFRHLTHGRDVLP